MRVVDIRVDLDILEDGMYNNRERGILRCLSLTKMCFSFISSHSITEKNMVEVAEVMDTMNLDVEAVDLLKGSK